MLYKFWLHKRTNQVQISLLAPIYSLWNKEINNDKCLASSRRKGK